MFFYFYKIIVNLMMPPSIFILSFFIFGLYFLKNSIIRHNKKRKLVFTMYFILCFTFYLTSIDIGKNFFVKSLEKRFDPIEIRDLPEKIKIIMLGGGIYEDQKRSFSSEGTVSYSASIRLIETARIYLKCKKLNKDVKVILSGGKVFNRKLSEAEVYGDYLYDLGVNKKDLIIEEMSRSTYENARNSKKNIKNEEKIILVTSATHMKRAKYVFENAGIDLIAAPCDFLYEKNYSVFSFIPEAENISSVKKVLWERIGYFYYKMRYGKKA